MTHYCGICHRPLHVISGYSFFFKLERTQVAEIAQDFWQSVKYAMRSKA